MKKFLAAVIAAMMVFTLILPAMAESGLPAEILPEEAADLNEALNVPGGTLDFVSEGTYPWVVEEDWAKSTNAGIGSSESTVSTTVTAVEGDIVQFDFTSGGEGSNPTYDWDNLKFKVDGVEVIHWALHNEWETYSQALEEGEHTLSWVYKKDGSVNPTPDFAQLDNVYVGEPVEVNTINVEDLTVAGNRHAQLVWEVLPAAAFDKSVTFAVDDETIATVDEEGVVAGIAEGETTVTVTSVAVPEVSGTATITVPEVLPELTLDSVLNVEGGNLNFVSEGDYPWVIPETAPMGQEYAKSSNEGVRSSSSTIKTTVTAAENDILRFDFQCWGEGAYTHWDKLQLMIDGTAIIDWGEGPKEWTTYVTALTAGEHTVEWTYSKDYSGDKEGDHAFLDNVYVGQPPLPEEILVNAITVHAGRRATAVYTVLPDEAFNKDVTFKIAHPETASVDENGVVTGIAPGETVLTVTSVANPEVCGKAVVTVGEPLPPVWLYGYMAFDPDGTSDIWGKFSDVDPSVVENMGEMETTFAGAFAGGKVYGYTFTDAGNGVFYIVDPLNGFTAATNGYNPGIGVFGMAYDHANDKMYALCDSPTDEDARALYIVDLATGALTYAADLDAGSESIMTLAISTDGTAYGLTYADENFGGGISELYSINLETGECELIGSTGLGLAYVQSMTWDHNTNQLFWAQYAHDGSSGLYTIDVETGAATHYGTIGTGAEVTALFTIDDIEIPPIVMPDCTISFMDGLTGEEIPGSYVVPAGSVLNPEDFPEAPEHLTYEFTGWDYDGHVIYTDTVVTALYYDPYVIGFYFETQEDVDKWTCEDHDGDGYNWQWIHDIADWGCPEGTGCMNSQSFVNYVGPLTPDNWLISPEVPGGGSMSFKLCAQDGWYDEEYIGVYASIDGGATWSDELGYFAPKAPGLVYTFTVDLADFAGQQIKLAFRHYDSSDAFSVNLDAVEVTTPRPKQLTLDEALNFEEGAIHFISNGEYPWIVPFGESYAKSSNEGVPATKSILYTEVSADEGDILRFVYQSWGEEGGLGDSMQLYIDGVEIARWGAGPYDWTIYRQDLEWSVNSMTKSFTLKGLVPGEHIIEWIYEKNGETDPEGDHGLLDDVYIGEPIPEEIQIDDIIVFVGETEDANDYITVLPANSADKSVTFEIADETKATVDEDGIITGVHTGITEITVRSVANPDVFAKAQVTVTVDLDVALNMPGLTEDDPGWINFVTDEDNYPWVVAIDEEDAYGKSSNEGVNDSESTVYAVITAEPGDILQFEYQSWGEGGFWDSFAFYIDGVNIEEWADAPHVWTGYGMELPWVENEGAGTVTVQNLQPGEHVVQWTFRKDSVWAGEGDHAFLNNVYVGAPVSPEEIVVDDLEIVIGHIENLVYSVLPAETYNKEVTFEVADEAIATIDEFGKVTAVAVGETEVTVTSVEDPTIFGTATITVVDGLPPTVLNGFIAYDYDIYGIWGQFSEADPSVVENMGEMYDTFAGAFAGGKVYGYLQSGEFYITDVSAVPYTTVFPGTKANVLVVAMAYNYVNNKMYAVAQDPADYSIGLYTADLATGILTPIAVLDCPDLIATLAIDGEGNAYGINMGPDAALWSIDLETAACEMIGRTGYNMNYVQGMTWDHNTNKLYWAQYDGETSGCLCIVDPATGAVTKACGAVGVAAEVTALWIRNDIEIPPLEMPECTISFMDGYTGEEIPDSSYVVEAGTVLDPEDFPEAPDHTDVGLEFTNWDYDGHAIYQDTVVTAKYRDPNAIGYYFETDPAADGWTWEDHDGDGYNWSWISVLVDPGYADFGFPEGQGCMNSQSYVNYVGPLFPDNWLISPEVPGGGMMSFMLCAQDGGYADEHIGVYASADGGETWSEELGYFTPKTPGPVFTFTVSLAEYADMNIKLAFRHYDSTDAFSVNLDAVEVSAGGGGDATLPEEITVEPIEVLVGETAPVVYNILPDDADDLRVTFAVADETIATVDENGVVTGVAAGVTEITVTSVGDPEVSGTATITVTEPAPEILLGDYDCDGDVDCADAVLTLRAAMGLIEPSEQSLLNADVDFDGELTTADAIMILRAVMDLGELTPPEV